MSYAPDCLISSFTSVLKLKVIEITVKGFNFAVLKFRGFFMGTFRGCFNFADFEFSGVHVARDNYRQKCCKMIAVVLISRKNRRPQT